MDKENVVYIYDEILFSLKNKENPIIYINMDEGGGHYTQVK